MSGIPLTVDHPASEASLVVEVESAERRFGVVPTNQTKLLSGRMVGKERFAEK